MEAAIRFEGISKRFPGVDALRTVSLEVEPASCHALCGENGAGKSTLGKILAGIHKPDAGRLLINGQETRFSSPRDALLAGICIVHQESAFCHNMTVAENLCLPKLPAKRGFVHRAEMKARACTMLAAIGAAMDVDQAMADLDVAQQQLVQIAAAVGSGARIIIFDEPTSSLSEAEAKRLYALIERLRADGVTCLYVSHRMAEIFRLCDRVSVLRDGQHVDTRAVASTREAELIELMIGRQLGEYYPQHIASRPGAEVLRADGLSSAGKFEDVSFSLHAGEVVGLAGLVGAGRSEIARALFGLQPVTRGRLYIDGKPAVFNSPRDAMRGGIGLVPEDRKRHGLVLSETGSHNATLPILERISKRGFIDLSKERSTVRDYFARLRVTPAAEDNDVVALSGGNQQKIVLAKWLAARCRILLLDEPTRGVDVGAKAEIHALIDQLAAEGAAILLISSELPEVIHLSTRILVVRAGRIVAEVPRAQATQAGLLRLMTGIDE